jgi:uncharacterized membrane protein YwaF
VVFVLIFTDLLQMLRIQRFIASVFQIIFLFRFFWATSPRNLMQLLSPDEEIRQKIEIKKISFWSDFDLASVLIVYPYLDFTF